MPNDFSALLLELYRLAHESPLATFQGQALALLQQTLRFDSARWASGELPASRIRRIHHSYLHHEPPEVLAAYHEVRDQDAPTLDLLRASTLANLAIAYHSATRFADRKTVAFRDYQRRFRHENVMTVADKRPMADALQYRLVSLYRADGDHQYANSEVRLVQAVFPHLMQALTINRASNLPARADAANPRANAVGVADLAGTILHCEPGLAPLRRREWPGWRAVHVPPRLWADVVAGQVYRGHAIVALGEHVQSTVFIRVRERCLADTLSARELEVARQLAQGCTHKHVARALGISPTTARNHMQRINEKLGAHNAAEVTARVLERAFA
jgi:DNA-binding CsgD family transcriptional regulator